MMDQEEEPAPLIIVEGFLCSASKSIWGQFDDHLDIGSANQLNQSRQDSIPTRRRTRKRRVILVPIGPLSSIHDRACELFHALRGSTVDYGHVHASKHGHSRYGRQARPALLPGWGTSVKAHFLGHSLGGLTILKMYDLLCSGFFDSYLGLPQDGNNNAASQFVLSLTTISSPHRGTPLVYILGSEATSIPLVRFLSAGDCLAKLVHLLVWARRLPFARNRFFDIDDWLPDFFADAWQFAGEASVERCSRIRRDGGEEEEVEENYTGFYKEYCSCSSKEDLTTTTQYNRDARNSSSWKIREAFGLNSLFSQWRKSSWAEGRDCAPWDCTFRQREAEEEKEDTIWSNSRNKGEVPPIWLRSFAACSTSTFAWSSILSKFDYSSSLPPGLRRRSTKYAEDRHVDSGYTSASEVKNVESVGKREKQKESIEIPLDWHHNDGVVPLASQYHPSDCMPGYCQHGKWMANNDKMQTLQSPLLSLGTIFSTIRWLLPKTVPNEAQARKSSDTTATTKPNQNISQQPSSSTTPPLPLSNLWYVSVLENTTHASLAPFFTGSEKQMSFWQDVGCWLQQVEDASTINSI